MKKTPVLKKIMLPLMLLVVLEITILLGTMQGQGVLDQIRSNEADIIKGRVEARRNYLESLIANQWMNIGQTVENVNQITEKRLRSGALRYEELDGSSEYASELLNEITGELIGLMRSNRVTGAFVVLNTRDLKADMESGIYQDKPGVYLRDLDGESRSSPRNLDILIERSPLLTVRSRQIATDAGWNLNFSFGSSGVPYYDFLYEPTQAVFESTENISWWDLGYWSKPYSLHGERRCAISYSVPLLLSDGRIYGVLGVDILLDMLDKYLSADELSEAHSAAYFIGISEGMEAECFTQIIDPGERVSKRICPKTGALLPETEEHFIYSLPLRISSASGRLSEASWSLGASVPLASLERFALKIKFSIGLASLAMLLIGALGSLLISLRLGKPIQALAEEIRGKEALDTSGKLTKTGILEIDQMSEALEVLSKRLFRERQTLQYERDHDFLTDIYNRRAFGRRISELLEEEKERKQKGVGAYLMIDLDNLKLANDTYGHEFGDCYIRAAADAIKRALGDRALYARISGDEFNIFIYDPEGSRKKVEGMIEQLRRELYESSIPLPDGGRQMLRLSGGISWYPEEGTTQEILQKNADYAMYVVKKASKRQTRTEKNDFKNQNLTDQEPAT